MSKITKPSRAGFWDFGVRYRLKIGLKHAAKIVVTFLAVTTCVAAQQGYPAQAEAGVEAQLAPQYKDARQFEDFDELDSDVSTYDRPILLDQRHKPTYLLREYADTSSSPSLREIFPLYMFRVVEPAQRLPLFGLAGEPEWVSDVVISVTENNQRRARCQAAIAEIQKSGSLAAAQARAIRSGGAGALTEVGRSYLANCLWPIGHANVPGMLQAWMRQYVGFLEFSDPSSRTLPDYCTVTFVDSRHAITAYHCVKGRESEEVLQKFSIGSAFDGNGNQEAISWRRTGIKITGRPLAHNDGTGPSDYVYLSLKSPETWPHWEDLTPPPDVLYQEDETLLLKPAAVGTWINRGDALGHAFTSMPTLYIDAGGQCTVALVASSQSLAHRCQVMRGSSGSPIAVSRSGGSPPVMYGIHTEGKSLAFRKFYGEDWDYNLAKRLGVAFDASLVLNVAIIIKPLGQLSQEQ